MLGMSRSPDQADFPMPDLVPMLQVCEHFGWTPMDYRAMDNEDAEWAHAYVAAMAAARKSKDKS